MLKMSGDGHSSETIQLTGLYLPQPNQSLALA